MSTHEFAAVSIVAPKGWNDQLHQHSNVLALKVWKTFETQEAGHEWAKMMQDNDMLDASVYLVQMRRWLPLPPPNGVKAFTGDPRVDEIINHARQSGVKQEEERLHRVEEARKSVIEKEKALKEDESSGEKLSDPAPASASEEEQDSLGPALATHYLPSVRRMADKAKAAKK